MLKCKYCESDNTIKKGIKYNKQEYYCKDCKKYFQEGSDKRLKRDIKERENKNKILKKSQSCFNLTTYARMFAVGKQVYQLYKFT